MMEKSCREFLDMLASRAPVPGGGGASALAGALGMALGSMVGNLTLNKKKYENVQDDIQGILGRANALQQELLVLVEKDGEVFAPLSRVYGLPRGTEEEKKIREEEMEAALENACSVPMEIMEKCLGCIDLHEKLSEKGTGIAISDIGVGVLLCKSALMGAQLNVQINTSSMRNRPCAEELNARAARMMESGVRKADLVYQRVEKRIVG
ncbi:cyclodeaminase/cyclohydrolase family protein [Eubacteriales bacterium mix99]|jgi:formiminotetrahydrofolate cyclodeaminase